MLTDILVQFVKVIVPGSISSLMLGLAAGIFLAGRSSRILRRLGVWWLLLIATMYLSLSLPWTATALASTLYWYDPVGDRSLPSNVTTLAVFDGDYPQSRVAEAARLFGKFQPRRVIVSGDSSFRDALIEAGVPASRMIWDARSQNTREQVLELRELAASERVLLVTSPLHMPRALGTCRVAGVAALPAVARAPHLVFGRGFWRIVPDIQALTLSRETLYEYLALAYYQFEGWADRAS